MGIVIPYTPLAVEPTFLVWEGHQIATYRAGSGETVILIHSINAAASAYEMREPFMGLQDQFRVWAVDLLGYGRSDRPARLYRADDYCQLIGFLLRQVNEPVHIIASSLSSTYAVMATLRYPERVRSLTLVCPTGIDLLHRPPTPLNWVTYRLLYGPAGDVVFRLLTTRSSTRYFLRQEAFASRSSITPEVVENFYSASQQPGAKYAPICFVTNLLNCDISDVFGKVTQPILLVWGRDAKTTPLRQADNFLVRNPRAELVVLDGCSMLAQAERPNEFNRIVREFLARG